VSHEEELVRRAQQRDQAAFTQLYEGYFDKIYRYVVLRVRDQAEAEDITQQVFLKALRSISSFQWRGIPFSAWLFRIARNQVVDHQRKRARQATLPLDETVAGIGDDPQLLLEQKLSIKQLMVATKRLTEAQREVISLRFAGELPIAEVARIMNKSQGAIKALQHSAIVALRKVLSAEA
jgi:RNA polymerase sigma-70 factor (ECF subfamily)